MESGPVTYALRQVGPDRISCSAWGPGAAELVTGIPDLLGARDDPDGFVPRHPLLVDAFRRFPGLRPPRTGRVVEALVPAIIEQKVVGLDAFAGWRRLLLQYGTPAPGPAPAGMRVVPTTEGWQAIASWDWHLAGIDPRRARTAMGCLQVANSLERLGRDPDPSVLYRGLRSLPGVGVWTAAEVGARALGDADAVSIGDYHLPKVVGGPPHRLAPARGPGRGVPRAVAAPPLAGRPSARAQPAGHRAPSRAPHVTGRPPQDLTEGRAARRPAPRRLPRTGDPPRRRPASRATLPTAPRRRRAGRRHR